MSNIDQNDSNESAQKRETQTSKDVKTAVLLVWVMRIGLVLAVSSALVIIMAEVLFIALGADFNAPMTAKIPWIILGSISLGILVLAGIIKVKSYPDVTKADVMSYELREQGRKSHNILLKISALGCTLSTVIPALWYAIYATYIFTIEDGIIGWLLSVVAIIAGIVALVSTFRKTSTLYLFLYFGFNFLIFALFSLMSPIWIIIELLSGLGILSTFMVVKESPRRKFLPRLKSKTAKGLVLLLILAIASPVTVIFGAMPNYSNEYTLGTDMAAEEMEINFTWANTTMLNNESLYWMLQADQLSRIEVSVTLPVIYRFKGGCDDREWDIPVMVNNTFEEVENIPIDEIDTLDYVEDGMLEEFARNLTANGIPVDFMPLLPKEKYYMYPNDVNIKRFQKTYAIMKEYVERTGLEKLHRGIVVDTERDYSDFEENVALFWNETIHKEGREILTKMVDQMKKDQLKWKTGLTEWDEEVYNELVENKTTFVADATFQYHLDDFVDADDEQQHFYQISIIPPKTWDVVGVMTYDKEENSEHNFYGYCRAIDYFFGEMGVPYLYSEDSEQNILRKFRIAQNYGYKFVGIWAATSECCEASFHEDGSGWCGGYADRFGWKALYELCEELNTPESITFEFDGEFWYKWTYMHALQLVDLYMVGKPIYSSWPLNDVPRIRW